MDEYNNDLTRCKKLLKIKKELLKIKDKDEYKLENDYYKSYNCENEKDKILLETLFLINSFKKISIDKDTFETLMSMLTYIKTNNDISNKILTTYKKILVDIELEYNQNIRFYSVLNELCNDYENELKFIKK